MAKKKTESPKAEPKKETFELKIKDSFSPGGTIEQDGKTFKILSETIARDKATGQHYTIVK